AEHRMPTVLARNRGAAGARRALVAGTVTDITEVRTAGALQKIAAHGGLVTHLRTRRVQQRFRDDGKQLDDARVRRHLRHWCRSAEPQALPSDLDAPVEKACEGDQPLWPAHMLLQELNHIGAAGDVLGGCVVTAGLRAPSEGGGEIGRTFEREGMHGSTFPRGTRGASGILNRRDDVVVGSAPAYVAAHPVADLLCRARVALADASDAGHDLSRRAITALKTIALDESLLQRMQLVASREALDRRDLAPLHECSERQARFHPLAVHEHRARAALPEAAAFLRACEVQVLAQRVE